MKATGVSASARSIAPFSGSLIAGPRMRCGRVMSLALLLPPSRQQSSDPHGGPLALSSVISGSPVQGCRCFDDQSIGGFRETSI